jgi:hypothetical protein
VLETKKRRKEKDCKRLAVCSRSSAQSSTPDCPVVHQTVSGAPGWTPVKRSLLGKVQRCTAIIHRTVRWANGRQRNGRPRNPRATRGPRQWSAVGTGLSGVHRTVSGAPTGPELQRSSAPEKEGDPHRTVYSDCPVAHRTVRCATRQKASMTFLVGLQRLLASLGLLKGPLGAWRSYKKLTRNILRLQDSNLTHSILCDSDLSSVWVVNSVRCVLSSSCDLCAWLCCGFESCVLLFPPLLPCFFCDHHCKGERHQFVEIPRKQEKD